MVKVVISQFRAVKRECTTVYVHISQSYHVVLYSTK